LFIGYYLFLKKARRSPPRKNTVERVIGNATDVEQDEQLMIDVPPHFLIQAGC
jgi:hypothetical protein